MCCSLKLQRYYMVKIFKRSASLSPVHRVPRNPTLHEAENVMLHSKTTECKRKV